MGASNLTHMNIEQNLFVWKKTMAIVKISHDNKPLYFNEYTTSWHRRETHTKIISISFGRPQGQGANRGWG